MNGLVSSATRYSLSIFQLQSLFHCSKKMIPLRLLSLQLMMYFFYYVQAAEKALKAAKYTIDVDKSNVHNLNLICSGLDDSVLLHLASQLEGLVGSSTRMRYPDNLCFPRIPNEVYNAQMAEEALDLVKEIVERVKSRIP